MKRRNHYYATFAIPVVIYPQAAYVIPLTAMFRNFLVYSKHRANSCLLFR